MIRCALKKYRYGNDFQSAMTTSTSNRYKPPFAQLRGRLAQALEHIEPTVIRDSGRRSPRRAHQSACLHHPFGNDFEQPVHQRQQRRTDAEPLVQSVVAVEPTQCRLDLHRSCGEQERERHEPDREQSGQVDQHAPQVPEVCRA